MKKVISFIIFSIITIQSYSQNIRNNKFHIPINSNEVSFLQLDSLPNVSSEVLGRYTKDWLAQTYNVRKSLKIDKQKRKIEALISFKIDDNNIKEPLHYTAIISVDYKDGVARINLHNLNYTIGEEHNKKTVNVTYQIKEAVRAHTDELYPNTWDSLKKYGYQLLKKL